MKKLIVILILILLVLSPRIYWSVKDEKVLDIAVIDKTVAKKDYREHKGFFHILDSKKIVRPDGEFYDLGYNYYGFDPYDQVEMEPYRARKVDLIYVADTYGVFSDDLKKIPDGERSELIYGGMGLLEWNELMASRDQNTTLIAEFNSFASPTSDEISSIMQKNLGVNWSGWIGRHFPDLSNDEIPHWLIEGYQQQTGEDWLFVGPGLAFVHTTGQVAVLDGKESKRPPRFQLTSVGEEKFPKVKSSSYTYWFDVIEPVGNTEVLATYAFDLTEKSRSVLQELGIPEKFPAVLYQENKQTYYFAGDYADFDMQPLTKWEGVHNFYKYFAKDVSSFYWLTYFPMMEVIIDEAVERKYGEQIEK
ncbi:hypothetical protein ORD22_08585 [Sporosarcina sp. GW1-11]|uniref:hypothetical protein n=1 Tax=Sporosarcina sp. GW1-11 TaxID=2899126 RepID=UPI00294F1C3D|nr:hypothetical protein [Sporosarcina sp. GW1-11]MDV6378302.1 hypothetical protein [Sporosarcina sp. GW1-11]